MRNGVVEIIGPPGVGKTSVYDALCAKWHPGCRWIYPEAIAWQEQARSTIKESLELAMHRVLGKRIGKGIPVDYSLQFAAQYRQLADFCWKELSRPGLFPQHESGNRFRAAHFLFQDFGRYQIAIEKRGQQPCVLHEGLLQKSFLMHGDSWAVQERISAYAALLPLPHAIVLIDTPDSGLILKRLLSRKKIIASHTGKTKAELVADVERWQQVLRMLVGKMADMQVPVFEINGAHTIESNARQIMGLLIQLGNETDRNTESQQNKKGQIEKIQPRLPVGDAE